MDNWTGDGWSLRHVDSQAFINLEPSLKVGDWCYSPMPTVVAEWSTIEHAPYPFHLVKPYKLSDYYVAHNGSRRPIVLYMPGRDPWCVDGKCVKDGEYYGGWTVTGNPEAGTLTLQPSINMGGRYHGFLSNNKLSIDCEGRKYDQQNGALLF